MRKLHLSEVMIMINLVDLLFSENMKINILAKKIVINYQNKRGKWRQYSKEVNSKELVSVINQSRK